MPVRSESAGSSSDRSIHLFFKGYRGREIQRSATTGLRGLPGIFLEYSVIVTPNLVHKSRRGIKDIPVTKIRGKEVRVVGLTSHMRLTPPPPKIPRGHRPRPGALLHLQARESSRNQSPCLLRIATTPAEKARAESGIPHPRGISVEGRSVNVTSKNVMLISSVSVRRSRFRGTSTA